MDQKPVFTPGPWHQINGGCHISAKGQPGKIASAHEIYMDKATRLANAHLIAAAPDLYEVVRAVFGSAEFFQVDEKIAAKARDAIAKAEGR
jgi:hypothetical protein